MKMTPGLVALAIAVSAVSAVAAGSDELAEPRAQLAVLGGVSMFRGGSPATPLRPAVPFQPDVDSPTAAGSLAVRLFRHLGVEMEIAQSWGRGNDPDNLFYGGGAQLRWPIGAGRLVPYLSIGGGVVERRSRDDFQRTVERAFEVEGTDPQAYARGGVEWRFSRLVGARAEYRYFRVFAGDVPALEVRRGAYDSHRIAGGLSVAF
jgi:opacity protein-like surface antigen